MPDPVDQASLRQRRANWVGLRTLRQRPRLAATLADGEPVYEVRSVRLLLRGQSPTFNRLVACERCGRDQAGQPVLSVADLDLPLRPMICADCVQRAGVSSVWEPKATRTPAAPVPAQSERNPVAPGGANPLVALPDSRYEALSERLEELSRLAERRQVADEERARQQSVPPATTAALTQALADARADFTSVSEQHAARVAALEVNLRETVGGLTRLVEAQRVDLTVIVREVVQASSEIQRMVAVSDRLAEAQMRLEQGVTATLEQAGASNVEELSRLQAALEQRLHELAGQVALGAAEQVASSYAAELSRVQASIE